MILAAALIALQAAGSAVPDSLASAYRDQAARGLVERHRAARARQDSALLSYDARSFQRVSVGFSPAGIGRDRMMFGYETVGRVRWQYGRGAHIEILGTRTRGLVNDLTPPVPYHPGSEPLWIKGGPVAEALEPVALRHPLTSGSEVWYTYAAGDSVTIELNTGARIELRELRVRPREVDPYLVVGSFWFEVSSGQLVRAAYRPSAPLDLMAALRDSPDSATRAENRGVGAMIGRFIADPVSIRVGSIAIEYALHDQRFWLPRSRSLTAAMHASIAAGSVRVDQRFTYDGVNGRDSIPMVVVRGAPVDSDTLTGQDKVDAVAGLRPDSADECARGDHYTVTSMQDGVAVAMRVPCDRAVLARSGALPVSIFAALDSNDVAEDDFAERALGLAAQAPTLSGLPRPDVRYGLSWLRFNRVEGLSLGAQLDQRLGGGFTARAIGRYGLGDRQPNAELSLTRSDLTDSIDLRVFDRLAYANDWGNPLSITASLAAALSARDGGFYYRTRGVELGGGQTASFARGAHVTWRVFAEEQDSATVTQARAVFRTPFVPNVIADRGSWFGGALRLTRTLGLDPRATRVLADVRLEAAVGETEYGRLAFDVTTSRPMGRYAGALTVAAGTSVGELPLQRAWFLGGPHTVRGQLPDPAASGNAFWLVRGEFSPNAQARLSLFGDIGWAGDRTRVRDAGRPLSGVGLGLSLFDGFVRLDLARGVHPRKAWRFEAYLGARY